MILLTGGLVYTKHQFNKTDILIKEDTIIQMAPSIKKDPQYTIIEAFGKVILPGFIDMHVHLREPGFTDKETIASGTKAAARGGFTTIAAMPNTLPVTDSGQRVTELKQLIEKDAIVNVLIYGAITENEAGLTLTDFSGLSSSGVVAFSDDGKGVQSEALMAEAMNRAVNINQIIVAHCEDSGLCGNGILHEGTVSKRHMLKGIPSAAEYKQVERDLFLAKKTGCRYHICHVSTKETVDLVRKAKASGVKVSCEVTPHHLLLCEGDIDIENANFKMNPPLRSQTDREALIEGLIDHTIDIIATDHAPHTEAEKAKGFQDAPFGIVGLETCFPLLYTRLVLEKKLSLEELIDCMTDKPRKLFGLTGGLLEEGAPADLTIIDLNKTVVIDPNHFASKGRNTPFEGAKCKGAIEMTLVKGKIIYDSTSV